jgi:DNA-binding LytR/AlgR family response regulator
VIIIRIAVCEDDSAERVALCSYIESYCERYLYHGEITTFESGEALLEVFAPGAFDLYFIDIYLPGLSGMDTARKIRESDRDCLFIFTTCSENHTMDGFMINASGYVAKPLKREQMDAAMHMCRQTFERSSRVIPVPVAGQVQHIRVVDILYVEVFDKDTVFHMKNGKLTAHLPLDEIESRLGGVPFLRCHRSFIVNMNQVADLRDNDFLMHSGDAVPIRVNGRKKVRIAMANFLAGELPEVM